VIKAGDGPIACPHCKAAVETPAGAPAAPPAAAPSEAPAATAPGPAPVEASSVPAAPLGEIPRIPDSAEGELRGDYEDQGGPAFPPRQRRHPLLVVLTVLLILFVLLPVALIVLFLAVCALAARS